MQHYFDDPDLNVFVNLTRVDPRKNNETNLVFYYFVALKKKNKHEILYWNN